MEVTVIEPWKVELVRRYFNRGSSVPATPPPPPVSSGKDTSRHRSDRLSSCSIKGNNSEMNPSWDEDESEGAVPPVSADVLPPVIVSRPKLRTRRKLGSPDLLPRVPSRLVTDRRMFPIQLSEQNEKDQGRTCVSVVLKNSETVPVRVMRIEELSAKYKVRYQCKSSQRCGARLDFCFQSATEARNFFRRVNDMERRKSISVIMTTEEGLGYQHLPALSEKELLNVQSPNYSRNIFKTFVKDIMVDVNSSDEVSFVFRTVADVNAFLFEVGNSKGLRTLGELKKNTKDLVFKPRQGQFVLFSEDDSSILEGLGEEFEFELSTDCDGISALKFEDKVKMFEFLLSQKGNNLQQLALDQSQIVSPGGVDGTPDEPIAQPLDLNLEELRKMIVPGVEENIAKNQDSVEENHNIGIEEILAEKNKEIEDLKSVNERQLIQQKKLEKKYYELQNQFQQINSICLSSVNHET